MRIESRNHGDTKPWGHSTLPLRVANLPQDGHRHYPLAPNLRGNDVLCLREPFIDSKMIGNSFMNRLKHRLVAITALLFVFLFTALNCQSDEPTDSSLRDLMGELKAERAKLKRYVVTCTFIVSEIPDYPQGLKMTLEVSAADDHDLAIYDYRNCEVGQKKPTRWQGKSGPYFVSGEEGGDSVLAAWPTKIDPMRTLPRFDVLGIGFGFLGELKFGTKLDKIISNYLEYPNLSLANKEVFGLIHSSNGRPRIVFDKKRGFWPLNSKLDHATWNIKLEQINEIHVPIWFEFIELINGREPSGKVEVDLKWENINEDFAVGRASALALADRFGCQLVADSDEKLLKKR